MFKSIPITSIHAPDNMRAAYPKIAPLMQNIKDYGLLNPITVVPSKGQKSFTLVAGHRRLLACEKLGFKTIEAHVLPTLNKTEQLSTQASENAHQVQPTPLEYHEMVKKLKTKGLRDNEIAVVMNTSVATLQKMRKIGTKVSTDNLKRMSWGKPGNRNDFTTSKVNQMLIACGNSSLSKDLTQQLVDLIPEIKQTGKYLIIARLVATGLTPKQAVKKASTHKIASARIPISHKAYNVIKNDYGSFDTWVKDVVKEALKDEYGL